MNIQNNYPSGIILSIGEKYQNDNFNGTVRLNILAPAWSSCPIGNVTFEPGCRGYSQEWEKPAQKHRRGT